jgi:hypothetical protein
VYYPERWVTAPFGGLLVWPEGYKPQFSLADEQLWKVEVEEQVPLPPYAVRTWSVIDPDVMYNLMQRLWQGETLHPRYLDEWPTGTEAWKRVKLVERLA